MKKLKFSLTILLSCLGNNLFASALVLDSQAKNTLGNIDYLAQNANSLSKKRPLDDISPKESRSDTRNNNTAESFVKFVHKQHEVAQTNIAKNFFEIDDSPAPELSQIAEFVKDMESEINNGNGDMQNVTRAMCRKNLLNSELIDEFGIRLTVIEHKEPQILEYLQEIAEEARQNKIDSSEEK